MVHPHLRGAYAALPRQQLIFPGSSPHTWGILHLALGLAVEIRFIPTYVGHTAHWSCWPGPFSVHPHIRGAYAGTLPPLPPLRGSSPHTWGIRAARYGACLGNLGGSSPHTWGIRGWRWGCRGWGRFIPTYVGHTSSPLRSPHQERFIPTYVGHTHAAAQPQAVDDGSSPHTWGIRQRQQYG